MYDIITKEEWEVGMIASLAKFVKIFSILTLVAIVLLAIAFFAQARAQGVVSIQ